MSVRPDSQCARTAATSRRERRTGSQSGFRVRQVALQRFYNRGVFHPEVRCPVSAMSTTTVPRQVDLAALARDIRGWGIELGFAEIGIADTALAAEEVRLSAWLAAG